MNRIDHEFEARVLDARAQQRHDLVGSCDIAHGPEQNRHSRKAPQQQLQFVQAVGVEPSEDFIGLYRMALPQQGARQELTRLQTALALEGHTRDAFAQWQVGQEDGILGRVDQKAGLDSLVAVDGQLCHPDPARGRSKFTVAQHLNDPAPQPPRRCLSNATAHDIAHEWVAEAGVEYGTVLNDPDQAACLGLIDGVVACQLGQRIKVQWFAQRQQLQRVDNVVSGLIEAGFQQRRQSRGNGGGPAELPYVVNSGQGACVDRAFHQMAQEQGIAAGGLPHQVGAEAFEGSANDRLDQRNTLLLVERLQLKPLQVAVLPQRCHRIGDRFTAADGGQDAPGVVDGYLMQQRRGQLVQQVCVIDAYDGILLRNKRFPRGRE